MNTPRLPIAEQYGPAVAQTLPVGLAFASTTASEHVPVFAQRAEQLGFGELWFAEDCFLSGGIAAAATALAVTREIPVGLGIISAMTRHPAVMAMELSTLARIHPGRLRPGIGLGVPAWLEQMGLRPNSMLTALREVVGTLRTLLDGGSVTFEGETVTARGIALSFPPTEPLPIHMGVVGPKAARLSGEIADGNILSVLACVDYVRRTRALIAEGAETASRPTRRPLAVMAIFATSVDGAVAKRSVRDTIAFFLSEGGPSTLTDVYGISDELAEMLTRGGADLVAREMPDAWVEDLAVAGTPDECAEKIDRLLDSGAGSVVLAPVDDGLPTLEWAAREVLSKVAVG